MGEPMDRFLRGFVKFDSSFEEAFPSLENEVRQLATESASRHFDTFCNDQQ
jgi:hypothetical protein